MRRKDYLGERFGKLECIGRDGRKWIWRCDCGNQRIATAGDILKVVNRNGVPHCNSACRLRERAKTHGMSKTRFYRIWAGMRQRCQNPESPAYPYYGGRGIRVCDRWESFEAFHEDMAHSYAKGLTLERLDNDGDYCPENCEWATRKDQASNRRNNHYVEFECETITVSEASRRVGIEESSMRQRLAEGRDIMSPPKRAKVYETLEGPMTIAEMANKVGVHPRTIRKRIYTYELPIERWLEPVRQQRTTSSTAGHGVDL